MQQLSFDFACKSVRRGGSRAGAGRKKKRGAVSHQTRPRFASRFPQHVTMRLGADPIKLHDGSRAREVYGEAVVYERHRHRYEVNNLLRKRLEAAGLRASGTSPDERLVEVIELDEHPFFIASQFHPEFKSRPERPAPLFRDFVAAALDRSRTRAGVEVA